MVDIRPVRAYPEGVIPPGVAEEKHVEPEPTEVTEVQGETPEDVQAQVVSQMIASGAVSSSQLQDILKIVLRRRM